MICGIAEIPHLNVRGVVEKEEDNNYKIALSKKSQDFLITREVEISAPNALNKLSIGDEVFLKFKNILINRNSLNFQEIEVYQYKENIKKENKNRVVWWTANDYGGLLKNTGESFIYNGNTYVESDIDYSEDGKKYFVDIYDNQLLIEEYKNIFPPMKWYNMINPQETFFNEIVKIYKNK